MRALGHLAADDLLEGVLARARLGVEGVHEMHGCAGEASVSEGF